ncbi:thymidylate synthase [Candidatus Pacearchaeota archaeon]|nr:thymidylate synthase [Candidatus Pacearchaeota archaeon]
MALLEPVLIQATNLGDAWFQCLHRLIRGPAHEYTITRGSYAGQKRREFDFVTVHIANPGERPLAPIMPEGSGIPPPTDENYINNQYLLYLLTGEKKPNEDYTYGERLVSPILRLEGKEIPMGVNPLEELVKMYKSQGYGTNQATLEIGMPSDIILKDPPCLRLIDTRIMQGKLHIIVYFRSWDLWGGFPANLGGLQLVKEYIASEVGVKDGEMVACSKGLHLYDYAWPLAEALTQQKRQPVKEM